MHVVIVYSLRQVVHSENEKKKKTFHGSIPL